MLIDTVPELAGCDEIYTETLTKLPCGSLSFSILFAALAWIKEPVNKKAAGVVLTQGTDTLEQTSFLLSLYWDSPRPLVVTGAMRAPTAAGADGPVNILSSVIEAKDNTSKNRSVLIVVNDEIHSPCWVRKSHSLKIETFQSGSVGALGFIVENKPIFFNPPHIFSKSVKSPLTLDKKVALVEMCLSSGHDHLKPIFESGLYNAAVLAAF